MSLLDKFLSKKEEYSPLPEGSYAQQRILAVKNELLDLASEISERLEVVPSEHAAYVFIGKPPKKFGLAWVHDGKVSNFKTLVEEHSVNPIQLERITDQLRKAYESSAESPRYSLTLGDREMVVSPSEELEGQVHQIIDDVLAK